MTTGADVGPPALTGKERISRGDKYRYKHDRQRHIAKASRRSGGKRNVWLKQGGHPESVLFTDSNITVFILPLLFFI